MLLCLLAAPAANAGPQEAKPELPSNPADLVRAAVNNQMEFNSGIHYRYRITNKKPDGTQTREIIETKEGVIARLIAENGHPLNADQRANEDRRLQRLLDDPKTLANKQKEQKDDDRRTRMMLKAMPDAFLYQYAGTEETPEGEVVKLTFQPNPKFDPPSRETMVYKGMQGTMEINLPSKRLAKIHARLFRDVSFGWGILGHLDSGGQFVVEQSRILDHDWEITHMVLNFTGKVLLFKSLKIRQDQTASDFRPVPEMTAAQAVEALKKADNQMEQQAKSGQK